jgi:hypothetical protein
MESQPGANTTKMTLNRPIKRPAPNLTKRNPKPHPSLKPLPLTPSEPHSGGQSHQNPKILFHKEDFNHHPWKIPNTRSKNQNYQTVKRKLQTRGPILYLQFYKPVQLPGGQ